MLRIVRRGAGSVVTWRRVQMVPLSAQGMPVVKIAQATFTGPDRIRDVIHDFDADGFGAASARGLLLRPRQSDHSPQASASAPAGPLHCGDGPPACLLPAAERWGRGCGAAPGHPFG